MGVRGLRFAHLGDVHLDRVYIFPVNNDVYDSGNSSRRSPGYGGNCSKEVDLVRSVGICGIRYG